VGNIKSEGTGNEAVVV